MVQTPVLSDRVNSHSPFSLFLFFSMMLKYKNWTRLKHFIVHICYPWPSNSVLTSVTNFSQLIFWRHCRKIPGVTNDINACSVSSKQYQHTGTGTPEWNEAIINVFNHTCISAAMTCSNVCHEKGTLLNKLCTKETNSQVPFELFLLSGLIAVISRVFWLLTTKSSALRKPFLVRN